MTCQNRMGLGRGCCEGDVCFVDECNTQVVTVPSRPVDDPAAPFNVTVNGISYTLQALGIGTVTQPNSGQGSNASIMQIPCACVLNELDGLPYSFSAGNPFSSTESNTISGIFSDAGGEVVSSLENDPWKIATVSRVGSASTPEVQIAANFTTPISLFGFGGAGVFPGPLANALFRVEILGAERLVEGILETLPNGTLVKKLTDISVTTSSTETFNRREGADYIFDAQTTSTISWTCLLYTSPSPRDRG